MLQIETHDTASSLGCCTPLFFHAAIEPQLQQQQQQQLQAQKKQRTNIVHMGTSVAAKQPDDLAPFWYFSNVACPLPIS